jgi:transaldolase
MEIYIDTAEIDAIKKYWDMGVIDGVTTNPTLIARSGRVFSEVVAEIAEVVKGPISVEAVSTTAEELVEESKKLAEYGDHIVIKIPMTAEGLKATKELSKIGIKTNVTLVFSASQALLAAKAGATYVSIFVGRLDDRGHEGMDVVWETSQIFQNYEMESKIITASIRHPRHVIEAAKAGSHVATVPPSILDKMLEHPLTDDGLRRFAEDWAKVSKS